MGVFEKKLEIIVDKDGCGHEQNVTIVTTPVALSADAVVSDNNECDALGGVQLNIIGGTLGIIFVLMATIRLWQKKYLDHGKWMLRSYAVLLTIVTLYLLIGFS